MGFRTQITMNRGDLVVDGERPADEQNEAVVILTPDTTISEWEVFEDTTVADQNPDYDPQENVVIVSFLETPSDKPPGIEQGWPGWRDVDPTELFDGVCDRSIPFYAFPESRLENVTDEEEDELEPLDRLEEALRNAGYTDLERRNGEIVIEKFGTHRIMEDGSIKGDGNLKDKIRKVIQKELE